MNKDSIKASLSVLLQQAQTLEAKYYRRENEYAYRDPREFEAREAAHDFEDVKMAIADVMAKVV